jgi:hypothetical protein
VFAERGERAAQTGQVLGCDAGAIKKVEKEGKDKKGSKNKKEDVPSKGWFNFKGLDFSVVRETKAEIFFFKDYGDVLGMTMASEATVAVELGIAYASLCSVDNYCNGIVPQPLSYSQIVLRQKRNSERLLQAVKTSVEMLA